MFILKAKDTNYEHIVYEWLKTKNEETNAEEVKEQTYIKYHYMTEKYILGKLGGEMFSKLNTKTFQKFFDDEEINKMALSTQKTLFYIINASCQYGIVNNYKTNLNKIEVKIKTPKPKIVYLTKYEQQKVEELLYKKKGLKALGILMCLYTGLRIGELCGLRWGDIDLRNKSYRIEHTVQRIKNLDENATTKTKIIISEPKTLCSKRTVPIPDFLIPLLRKYKKEDHIFVFSDKDVPRDPRTFESYFERLLKKCKIDNINFHALRHTFATRSLEAGMDIKTLSEILGHSSYRITLDIYVHSSFDLKKDSLNVLVNYLSKGKRKKFENNSL